MENNNWSPSPDELEQEILILQWKKGISIADATLIATKKLKNIYDYSLSSISDSIDNYDFFSKSIFNDSYLPYILGQSDKDTTLSYYERYITYLLKYHKKKEVRQILGCTSSYLSKIISRIKAKLCFASLEES